MLAADGVPARLFRLARGLERLVGRHDVGGTRQPDQLGHLLPDQPVVVAIEIVFLDEVRDAVPGGVVQQEAAQHRLLRLHRVRRDAQGLELGIDGRIHRSGKPGVRAWTAEMPAHDSLARLGGRGIRRARQGRP